MNGLALHQRCWNHEHREAVCRCPECGRPYCRECVSEHETRLLCAVCLRAQAQVSRARGGRMRRRLAPAAMALAAILLSWAIFYGAGRAMSLLGDRAQEAAWNR
jgi:hypothetical protein